MPEVKEAMFAIGWMKAPSDDGFPTVFFQRSWNTICNSIFQASGKGF